MKLGPRAVFYLPQDRGEPRIVSGLPALYRTRARCSALSNGDGMFPLAEIRRVFHFAIPTLPSILPAPPTCAWADGVFAPQEIERINALAQSMPAKRVGVGRDLHVDPLVNRSSARWLVPSEQTFWIYDKLTQAVARLNAMHFHFEITGLDEELYYVTYDGTEEGHYDWHADSHHDSGFTRKLSVSVQMSGPADYEGGELELNGGGRPEAVSKTKGRLILFPSYTLHRVRPVTGGTRSALVSWIVGPPFR
jgi:PKHD-type hydroxylase